MGFLEGNDPARQEGDDVDMHVMRRIGRINKAGRGPASIRVWHGDGGNAAFIGHESAGFFHTGRRFPDLADPVKAGGRIAFGMQPPRQPCRNIGIASGIQFMRLCPQRQGDHTFGDEDHRLCAGVILGRVRAATGGHLHHILTEGFAETGHRARDQPEAGLAPPRQAAGDDIGKDAFGDDRIGFGEHRAAGVDGTLRRQAALGGVIGGHGSMSFSRSAAMRSTWAQAVANSAARSWASRA